LLSQDTLSRMEVYLWIQARYKMYWSVGDTQSFLGLTGYYQRFIEGFSKISKPMTELLEKDKKFEWTSAYEASFQELKK
jgi:hypothetical protein